MRKPPYQKSQKDTSWEPASKWYKTIVGEEGHYYHQHLILPNLLRLLNFKEYKEPSLLDLACGSGVLARQIPPQVKYTGLDLSTTLIKEAKKLDNDASHYYAVADAMKPLPLDQQKFSHATIVLAIQNIQHPLPVFKNAYKHLKENGLFFIVLNHPYFRIPRQTSWQIDENKKLQYRRVDRYMSPLEIPIQAHPSKGEISPNLNSYHYPLADYFHWLKEAGFKVVDMEEWCSNKTSTGGHAKMENRSRAEIPLFMTLCAQKC